MWSSSHGEGDPAEPVLEVARAASGDLVIIGRRGEDFVARTLLGSVATRVVEPAPLLSRAWSCWGPSQPGLESRSP